MRASSAAATARFVSFRSNTPLSSGVFAKVFQAGNALVATTADFGARQTLYAASQELPGNSYVGPRFAMWGPTGPTPLRSPLARDAKKAAALWELSEQLTDTKFPF